jgi:hypothetical protein
LAKRTTSTMSAMAFVVGESRRYAPINRSPVEFTFLGYKGRSGRTCLGHRTKKYIFSPKRRSDSGK